MPNWFAPERRNQTRDLLSSFGAMMFGVILLAIQAAFEISAYANLQTPIHFNAQTHVRDHGSGFYHNRVYVVQAGKILPSSSLK